MNTTVSRSLNPAIREVARGLVAARDAQIMQVLAMVDAMPERGAADQLIAPLRPRLARLRPPRPLRFARLLFQPLDPLIVSAGRWRMDQPAIPRTVIPVLAAAIETALGDLAVRIGAMIAGRTTADLMVVEAAGSLLWPAAASVLLKAGQAGDPASGTQEQALVPPSQWESTGLSIQAYRPLARRIGALLSQTELPRRMMADAAHGLVPPDPLVVNAFLAGVAVHDPGARPMAVALLLARIPEAALVMSRVLAVLDQREATLLRLAGEEAEDILLTHLEASGGAEAQIGGSDLREAAATARRLTSLLTALDKDAISPDRRVRLDRVRQRIRAGCQALFTERLTTDLLEPLRARAGLTSPEALWDLEEAARGLRALETEARRSGDDGAYDVMLEGAAAALRDLVLRGALDRGGGLRLLEIVAGPDAALALLEEPV